MQEKTTDFAWGPIFITAFGPSILFGIAQGTILPVIALTAIKLGASYAVSGVIAALIGIGVLSNNIPAAVFTRHVGERKALVGTSIFSIAGLLLCIVAANVWVLACGVLMQGLSTSVVNLARQSYIINVVPASLRARAFSIMGGTQRMGVFVGPFLGAGAIHFMGLKGAYWVAIIATIATGILCFFIPELLDEGPDTVPESESRAGATSKTQGRARALQHLWQIIVENRNVLLTLGLGVLCLGALRAARPVAIPLWAKYIGLDPTTTAIIFGLSAAIDIFFFYPAGMIMDKYGRGWIAVPSVLLMALAYGLMPFTASIFAFVLTTILLGIGNGISAGLVMTLGADAAPDDKKIEFLGVWRVFADAGHSIGPLLISLVTALSTLGLGILFIASTGLIAAWIFARGLLATTPRQR